MNERKYLSIVAFCEECLEKYGDNYLGVGWTKSQEDTDTRYRVMLDVINRSPIEKIKLLDFGCGASHLYEYILRQNLQNIEYSGLDVSEKFINLSKRKFPSINYYCLDILHEQTQLPDFDYVILNGILTVKRDLSFDEMFGYLQTLVIKAFMIARVGIAFNTMSKQVDWEREDLFHLPFDMLAYFLVKNVSRHFIIRHDYGLYEYTTYVYKQATRD